MIPAPVQRVSSVLHLAMGTGMVSVLYFIYQWGQGRCTDEPDFAVGLLPIAGFWFCLGILTGILIYGQKWFSTSAYLLNIILRYSLVFLLITYAMSVLLDYSFPDSLMALDRKIADLPPKDLVWAFFGHTYSYQAFIGWIQVLACCTLLFRASAPLGLIILLGVMSNVFMIQWSYGLCQKFETGIYLLVIAYLLIPFLPGLYNTLISNKASQPIRWPVIPGGGHGYKVVFVCKIVFLLGLIILYYNQTRRFHRYYYANSSSPVIGVWNVENIDYQPDDDTLYQDWKEVLDIQSLFLEKRRFGAVRARDTLTLFEYMIDTTQHRLEFWNFHQFRSFDFKGKYTLITPDTMIYTGTNNKDQIKMILSLDKKYKTIR